MLKIKTFFILTLVLLFSFFLLGCDLLSSFLAEPEQEVIEEELPAWLLLAHRSDQRFTDLDADLDLDDPVEEEEPDTQQTASSPAPAAAEQAPAATSPLDDVSNRANDLLKEALADEIDEVKDLFEKRLKELELEDDPGIDFNPKDGPNSDWF